MTRHAPRVVIGLLLAAALGCSKKSSGGGGGVVVPPPTGGVTVTGVNPSSGHPSGGDLLVIDGTGFDITAQVTIGGAQAPVLLIYGSTRLVVSTPAGSGATTLTVATSSGSGSRSFSYAVGSGTSSFRFQAGTDKWFINSDYTPEADADNDGLADLSEALAAARNNTGGTGFSDFEGALTFLLSFSAQLYHNNPDGSLASGGAPVSFVRAPFPVGSLPSSGQVMTPLTIMDHNLMAVRNVAFLAAGEERSGVIGRASTEVTRNNLVENNSGGTTSASGGNPALGVFADAALYFWNTSAIPNSQRTLSNFMEEVAAVLAHEIGHSMGLQHTNATPPAPADTNLMSPSSPFDVTNIYAFDSASYATFLGYMPGPLRLVHRSALAPRRLLAASDRVLLAQARPAGQDALDLTVRRVLSGPATDTLPLRGVAAQGGLSPAALSEAGEALFFLAPGPAGPGCGQTLAIPMSGRDPAEWEALVADYQALAALEQRDPVAWRAAYAARLGRSLASSDARIREDALAELSVDRDAAQALGADAAARVLALTGDAAAPLPARRLAALTLIHRADPTQADAALTAALRCEDPGLLRALAGQLEQSLGLELAAARVRARLSELDATGRARAVAVLGWLLDPAAAPLLLEELAAEPARARSAADALGRLGDPAALAALQALALDAGRDLTTRHHALRAVGRLGGAAAREWLDAQVAQGGSQGEAARFARDYPESWLLR